MMKIETSESSSWLQSRAPRGPLLLDAYVQAGGVTR